MAHTFEGIRRFLTELKRRNVYTVAVTYLAVAFVGLQAVNLLVPATTLPSWADELLVAILVIGFPVCLVVAWAFEMTPEGVRRTPERVPAEPEVAGESGTRARYGILVALGVAGAAGVGWHLLGGGGATPEIGERTVAVLPFEVSGAGAETWRDGMVTMLSTGLDGAGRLRAIPDRTVFAAWEERGQGRGREGASTGEALSVAREVGARYGVVGSAVALGDELRLVADVHGTPAGERLGRVEVGGSADSVTALADSLTRGLLGVLLEEGGEVLPGADLASQITQSVPALEAFLEGERHYRAGDFEPAAEDYRRAVARDSTFALAHWRLAWASGWIEAGTGTSHVQRAYALDGRLPRRERRLLRASWLWRVPNQAVPALDTLRRLTRAYPDDPRAWYELGEVILHSNLPGGWPAADRAFERAVRLDARHGPYHIHPLMAAFTLYRDSAVAARRWARHPNPEAVDPWVPLAMDLVFGSPETREEALGRIDSLAGGGDFAFFGLLGPSLWHPRDGRTVEEYQRMLSRYASSVPSLSGDLIRANQFQSLLRRGRVKEALHSLPETSASDRVACGLADAMSLDFPLPDSVLRAQLHPDRLGSGASLTRRLCSGIYLLETERTRLAEKLIARLRAGDADGTDDSAVSGARRRDVVDVLRGYRAWREGDLERAARLLVSSVHEPLFPVFSWRALWRGDVYRELGQTERAEGWYLAGWWHPLAHQRLGRVYEEMSEPEKAAAAYRRFIAAWEDADEELRPLIEEARKRLETLPGAEDQASE